MAHRIKRLSLSSWHMSKITSGLLQEHWDSNLMNVSHQNKKLLGDKKALLIQNKLLMDRLGVIREEATRDLISQIDELNLKLSSG